MKIVAIIAGIAINVYNMYSLLSYREAFNVTTWRILVVVCCVLILTGAIMLAMEAK